MAQTTIAVVDEPKPETVQTTITVAEKIEMEAPALVTVLDQTEIREQPGVNIDDRLRPIPGFTLFRRTSSVAANPTTQGVSLRGLGSSGAAGRSCFGTVSLSTILSAVGCTGHE